MIFNDIIEIGQWLFLLYFIGMNSGYLMLNVLSLFSLSNLMRANVIDALPQAYSGFESPISLLVPAYNEQTTITA